MDWIKTIFPLLGVLLGWFLSEGGKIITNKRQDKRKLKKLLFFILELRFHFAREHNYELDLDKCIGILKEKMAEKFGINKNDPELSVGLNSWKPIIEQLILKAKPKDDKFEHLSKNIDTIIIELAEILPILAYELNGRHNIKERLKSFDTYFNEVKSMSIEVPFDIKQWVDPKMTKELLKDIDESIEKIAKRIDRNTLCSAQEKVKRMEFQEDDQEMCALVDEYFEKVLANNSKQ